MVIVSTNNLSNIGFISRSLSHDELSQDQLCDLHLCPKKILSKLKDGDETIRNILHQKIQQENSVFLRCYSLLRGQPQSHQSQSFSGGPPSISSSSLLAVEYSFDQKSLFLYFQRGAGGPGQGEEENREEPGGDLEEVSVHRLGRKLFEMLKVKVNIFYAESGDELCGVAGKYLMLSQLNVTMDDLLPPPPPPPPVPSPTSGGASGLASYHPRLTQQSSSSSSSSSRTTAPSGDRSQYYPGLTRSLSGPSYSSRSSSGHGNGNPRATRSAHDLLQYGPPCVRHPAAHGYHGYDMGGDGGQQSQVAPVQGSKPVLLGPLTLLSPTSISNASPLSLLPSASFFPRPLPSPSAYAPAPGPGGPSSIFSETQLQYNQGNKHYPPAPHLYYPPPPARSYDFDEIGATPAYPSYHPPNPPSSGYNSGRFFGSGSGSSAIPYFQDPSDY
jgi:hypothetical protein